MSFSSNFLNLIIDSNCDLSVKSKYLEEGRHFNYFSSLDNKQIEPIKQKINSLLALHNKRLEGFLLLNQYLEECQHLLNTNETVSWSTHCLQSSTNKNVFEKQLAFICLRKIFNAANNSDMIYRMLSGTIVPQFIELLPQIKLQNCDLKTIKEFSLCFELCLKTFKGPCGSRKKLIEEFLINQSSLSNFVQLSKSFALLAFVGSNKQLQTNNLFNQFIIQCIYSLDTLIDSNFNIHHQLSYYSNIKDQPFIYLNNNLNRPERSLDFLNKLKFLSATIQHLLSEDFDGIVKIPITLILNLVQRLTSFKINTNDITANLESILNSNIIPSMYTNALLILNQLITTCSTNLSINLKIINNILINILETFNSDKNYLIEIKSLWYKVLSNLFNRLGNHLTVLINKQWDDILINNFLNDIQLKKDGLIIQNTKKLQNERILNTKFTENLFFNEPELELCSSACEMMNSFLINFARILNSKKFHKFIHQLLIVIQDIYRIDLCRRSTYFIDQNLRLCLMKIFRNCLISFTNTTLLNNAITILNTILKLDKSSDLQLFAKETLIIINYPKTKIYYSSYDLNNLQLDKSIQNNQHNSIDSLKDNQNLNSDNEKTNNSPINQNDNQNKEINLLENNLIIRDEIIENENLNQNNIDNEKETQNRSNEIGENRLNEKEENLNNEESLDTDYEEKNSDIEEVETNNEIIEIDPTILKNKEINCEIVNEKKLDEQETNRIVEEKKDQLESNDSKTPATKKQPRFKNNSKSDETSTFTPRLTRSSIKKKIEEENEQTKQPSPKKAKIVSENDQFKTINEDTEIEDILKDFVDN